MSPAARLVLCAAMVLGRVEVLAVVALANPAYWRA
jgi:trk system potassium uptake protein TrkH